MTPERELDLWKKVLPHNLRLLEPFMKKYVGTPPVYLARYLQDTEPDLTCTLHVSTHNVEALDRYRGLFRGLSALHDAVWLRRVKLNPSAVHHRQPPTTGDLHAWIRDSPRDHFLQVITIPGGMVHFVLMRSDGDSRVAVMDPLEGVNTLYDERAFEDTFGPRLFGYTIVLS